MKKVLIILFALVCTFQLKAQANLDYAKKQYPDIYNGIYNRATSAFSDSESQEKAINEQVFAFLDLAENENNISNDAMTEALLRWSIAGYEDYNQNTIEDLTIENPFPLLHCDWVLARLHYYRILSGIDKFEKGKSRKSTQASLTKSSRDRDYKLHYSREYLDLFKERYSRSATESIEIED